ncbi:2-polyprenyl-3-methyl-5-hydroxy-6-metoxy-1,4-benzoquinol methylase [Nitrobacteraceae bacterium AZCC 1564]
MRPDLAEESNEAARALWNRKAVGSDRALGAEKASSAYFERIRAYRYGYETPFIPRTFAFDALSGKRVLEIGVGNGIDAVEMMKGGAIYTGLDITENHLDLTRRHAALYNLSSQVEALIHQDLLSTELNAQFDVVYSFGVLHHVSHELDYLRKIRALLRPNGELRIAVYSKYSFFNAYLFATWVVRNRMKNSFDDWRSHVAEHSELGSPVTIKIRSRREVEAVLVSAGFAIARYEKRGFVQNYIPVLGRLLAPDGPTLAAFARLLGWYHCFICKPI